MKTIDIHEAKTHLSRLVEEAAAGKEIIIAKNGKPVARLAPLDKPSRPRSAGALKGRIRIAEDFDAPLPDEVMKSFLGDS